MYSRGDVEAYITSTLSKEYVKVHLVRVSNSDIDRCGGEVTSREINFKKSIGRLRYQDECLTEAGRLIRSAWYSVNVHADAYVSTRDIKAGEMLSDGMYRIGHSLDNGSLLKVSAQGPGVRAIKDIKESAPLTLENTADRTVLLKGEYVAVVSQAGGAVVRANGTLQVLGKPGSKVSVRVAGRLVNGWLTEGGVVYVK